MSDARDEHRGTGRVGSVDDVGEDVVEPGRTQTEVDEPWAGQPHSLRLTLPPLAAVYLTPGARR